MKAQSVAKRLQTQFPLISGIRAENDNVVHLGDSCEGGCISDSLDKKMARLYPEWGFGSGIPAADYYGEFRGGYPWIHPDLEEAVKKYGYSIEWQSPGEIKAYR